MHRAPYLRPALFLAGPLAFAAALLAPGTAHADVTHVIARGHTIETIAHRYHVTPKAIIDANHIKDPKNLKVGDTLVIPGVQASAHDHDKAAAHGKDKDKDHKTTATTATAAAAHGHASVDSRATAGADVANDDKPARESQPRVARIDRNADVSERHHDSYEAKPKQPDVVHAQHLGEEFTIRVKDHRGKIPPASMKTFGKMMRSGNAEHGVDPRLVALLGIVSNHFGGRKLEIVSGYRPYTPTQYTPHSNHNFGKALDFRVPGVPNEVLRDFCRTLRSVGVGYYPNSTFVHLDVRDTPAFWIDYSRPGEPPRYNSPNVAADEGTSDVPEDTHAPDPASNPSVPNGNATDNPYDSAPKEAPAVTTKPATP